jgi:hypothetical protein
MAAFTCDGEIRQGVHNMARSTICIVAILAFMCFLTTGCDRVRTTLQPVLLKVTDSASGTPIAGTRISVKWNYEQNVPIAEQKPEEERPTYKWFFGTTDPKGQVEVGVKWTMLDDTLGSTPPSWRDQVTGATYLISVEKDATREEHSVVMRPGAFIHGEAFTVQVLQIQPPRYIRTDE